MKDQKRVTSKSEAMIREFTQTFKGTKMTLMSFLTKYTRDDVLLDEDFFTTFNELVAILGERIQFEEENLYSLLYNKE